MSKSYLKKEHQTFHWRPAAKMQINAYKEILDNSF